jgi:hypothetical protein
VAGLATGARFLELRSRTEPSLGRRRPSPETALLTGLPGPIRPQNLGAILVQEAGGLGFVDQIGDEGGEGADHENGVRFVDFAAGPSING